MTLNLDLRIDQLQRLDPSITKQICFFYRGVVNYTSGKHQYYEGLVYPDVNIICFSHLAAALKHSPIYYTSQEDPDGKKRKEDQTKLYLMAERQDYKEAYLDAGNASGFNIHTSDSLIYPPIFHLQDYVLPYYVLPIGYFISFCKNIRINGIKQSYPLEYRALNECPTTQKSKPENTPHLDGDILKELLENLQKTLIQAQQEIDKLKGENIAQKLKQNIEQVQTKNTISELQQQLAAQTHKSNDTVTNPMQKKATAKLIGSLILKAFPQKGQGLKTHGLIGRVQAETGVTQSVVSAWIELAIEELS